MIVLSRPLALIILLGLAGAGVAQETTPEPTVPAATAEAPVPATPAVPAADTATEAAPDAAIGGLAIGQEVVNDAIGSSYVQEAFADWELTCLRTESGDDPCQLYQLLRDSNGNEVAEFSLFPLPDGQQAVAGATVVTPLETLLTEDLHIQVDQSNAKRYPFSFCTTAGCVARVGFTAEEVAALKAGITATLTIVPVAAPDQTVVLNLSLKGFTAGYEALGKAAAN